VVGCDTKTPGIVIGKPMSMGKDFDKCYRLVGDFEDGESEVSRVVDTDWFKCVLTPRDWGVLVPV
jgi:hypothetical protein